MSETTAAVDEPDAKKIVTDFVSNKTYREKSYGSFVTL